MRRKKNEAIGNGVRNVCPDPDDARELFDKMIENTKKYLKVYF